MKNSISVVIYTRNEEKNIAPCIESAKLLTDKILVVDMESMDKTVIIAKKMNAEILNFPFSFYVEPARKFGIEKAKTDWVFILDADERITLELQKEIKEIIQGNFQFPISNFQTNPKSKIQKNARTESVEERSGKTDSVDEIAAYYVPRKNIFGYKWLKYGGWSPDYQIRLINKNKFIDWPEQIHSTPIFKGEIGYLKNSMLHYFHGNFEKMVDKTVVFENIESDLLFKAKRKVKTITFFRKFLGELYRRLFKNQGFRDGTIGIMECIYQAYSKTITYLFLYEKLSRKENLPAGRQGRSL